MLEFGKRRGFLRLIFVVGLVLAPLISIRSRVSAQDNAAPLWVVRSLDTSEYGVIDPKGLAFSSVANTFLVLDQSANVALIGMGEDNEGIQNIPEVQNDSLNAAFDDQMSSLFVFNRANSELLQIKADTQGLPNASALQTRFPARAFGVKEAQGITFDPGTGRLFILDAGKSQIVSISPHPTLGFDGNEAVRSGKVQRIQLKNLGAGRLRGLAYNPNNGHLYLAEPDAKRLFEVTEAGDLVSTVDLAPLKINNPSAMTFAPSGDNTDDPNTFNLFMLDSSIGSEAASTSASQIVELSLVTPAALPAGTTLLPTNLVHVIDTSKAAWNPSAPDPSGVEYWPLTGRLLISDSEVDEMSSYFTGKNVFDSTLSGALVSTCSTTTQSRSGGFSNEPTGVGINPNNNRVYFTDDDSNKLFEVSLGPDGTYCTADDVVVTVNVGSLYNIQDAEDVTFSNNSIFVAGGDDAEVYRIPLGANGVLAGGDDGPVTHFDTAILGFSVLEGLGYNQANDTLLLISPKSGNAYVGEATTTGTLLRAYDVSYLTIKHREDITVAPNSQNSALQAFYIADRGVDNNTDSRENDGKVWEVNFSNFSTPQPSGTPTITNTPGSTFTPTATFTPGPSPTPTNTSQVTDLIFADNFESGNLSAWPSSVIDSGDLSISAAAALMGSQGLQALIDDNNPIYVADDRPASEPRYRTRFYLDPNSVPMVSGDGNNPFLAYAGSSTEVLRIGFGFTNGVYQVRVGLINDSGAWQNTSWFTISDAPHAIELDWRAATSAGANNGGLTLWIDGIQKANLTGVDNDTRRIDAVRLGAASGIDTGTRGTIFFDAFESRRESYIGP